MNISVFGLGYVGTVSAVCFARAGHRVIGVDKDREKVERVMKSISPVREPELNPLLEQMVKARCLEATTTGREAVRASEVSLITVGTPSSEDGTVELEAVKKVAGEIATVLAEKDAYHLIVVRSTVPPGTTEQLIAQIEQRSGKSIGPDFGMCMNPEFLREGTAISDFYSPPYTVIGESDEQSGKLLEDLYKSIGELKGEVYRVGLREAEMLKYANNCFHALKVTFANEMGRLCKEGGIEADAVMKLVAADHKLNLSSYYLKPGFAYGGSCLPKDTRATLQIGQRMGLELPLLEAAVESNEAHIRYTASRIMRLGKNRVGIIGVTFKEGTDDLRESPALRLAEALQEQNCEIRLYDRKVGLGGGLLGENKRILARLTSQRGDLMTRSMEELVRLSDVIVVTNSGQSEFEEALHLIRPEQVLFSLESGSCKLHRGPCQCEDLV